MSGKGHLFRERLLKWWRRWEQGYRGPMPYVVRSSYRVKSRHLRTSRVRCLWEDYSDGLLSSGVG